MRRRRNRGSRPRLQRVPETVGRALEHDAWTGYPALRNEAIAPSAVAYLDGGLWLHHTITHDADYRDVLTLIVPCTCGRGYAALQLENESDLLEVLDELRTTAGRSTRRGHRRPVLRQHHWLRPESTSCSDPAGANPHPHINTPGPPPAGP